MQCILIHNTALLDTNKDNDLVCGDDGPVGPVVQHLPVGLLGAGRSLKIEKNRLKKQIINTILGMKMKFLSMFFYTWN